MSQAAKPKTPKPVTLWVRKANGLAHSFVGAQPVFDPVVVLKGARRVRYAPVNRGAAAALKKKWDAGRLTKCPTCRRKRAETDA